MKELLFYVSIFSLVNHNTAWIGCTTNTSLLSYKGKLISEAPSDFNFNKKEFLKEQVLRLVNCVDPPNGCPPPAPSCPQPPPGCPPLTSKQSPGCPPLASCPSPPPGCPEPPTDCIGPPPPPNCPPPAPGCPIPSAGCRPPPTSCPSVPSPPGCPSEPSGTCPPAPQPGCGPPLPFCDSVSRNKSDVGSPDGKQRFIFEYTGSRKYKESCLSDPSKNDLIIRLHDASCVTYADKVKYLDSFSCDSSQHMECRKTGVEPSRAYADQDTPIMQCLCPNYYKPQTIMIPGVGYYDPKQMMCVLKVGKVCTVNAKGHDRRLVWRDFHYSSNKTNGSKEGIDVVDFRPIPTSRTCVQHAFCYSGGNKGLPIPKSSRNKCVCEAGYFAGDDGECHFGMEPPLFRGAFLAFIMFAIGLMAFLGGVYVN